MRYKGAIDIVFATALGYKRAMTDEAKMKRRRSLYTLAGLAAFVVASRGAFRLVDRLNSSFDFVDLDNPKGFRSLKQGEVSAPFDPFIGLDDSGPSYPAFDLTDIDAALFYARTNPERLQVAYFSDLYCPYCRVLSSQIIDLQLDLDFDISWHETPIFGEASVIAARGQIAAGRQGKYAQFHKSLSRTPVQVTYPFLEDRAGQQGLDIDQFENDFHSDETLVDLGRARALADAFGLAGTPALVVGRTLVIGQISEINLRQLIEIEQSSI